MEVRFKPRFHKDIERLKNDPEALTALAKVIQQVEKAASTKDIANLKKLVKFRTRFRIKLILDKKRDYRIGLYIRGNTVWFARLLPRKMIYDKNW